MYCVMNWDLDTTKKNKKDIAHLFSSIREDKYEDLIDDWLAANFETKRDYGCRWKFLSDRLKKIYVCVCVCICMYVSMYVCMYYTHTYVRLGFRIVP